MLLPKIMVQVLYLRDVETDEREIMRYALVPAHAATSELLKLCEAAEGRYQSYANAHDDGYEAHQKIATRLCAYLDRHKLWSQRQGTDRVKLPAPVSRLYVVCID